MDSFKTRGIVTRRAAYGEANCMLTVMTEDLGLISACAYGVRSRKSRLKAGAQPLAFSELVLSRRGGELYRVESAAVIEGFYPLLEDLTRLSLANYILEAAAEPFADGDRRILSLVLNTLYALAYRKADPMLSKAVFELKLAQYAGFEPVLDHCIHCGGADTAAFDYDGGAVCADCASAGMIPMPTGLYQALRYILAAEEKKILSFTVSPEVQKGLSRLAEGYFLHKSEKSYKSLDYFKKII